MFNDGFKCKHLQGAAVVTANHKRESSPHLKAPKDSSLLSIECCMMTYALGQNPQVLQSHYAEV